jgi:putative PIN family toxin of toxin-antitoxin system
MRIVIDTNLLVSGVISAGLPRQLVDAAKAGEFELCTSEVLLAELLDVIARSKFAARLSQAGLTPMDVVEDLRALAVVVWPITIARVVLTDPDDDHVLAAALMGAVDLIASGDKRDLLPLGSYQGIPIITAREALERIAVND